MVEGPDGMLRLFNGKPVYERTAQRQELSQTYWSIGMMYLFKANLLFETNPPNFYGTNVMPYVVDPRYVVDINVPEDWEIAEKAMEKLRITGNE